MLKRKIPNEYRAFVDYLDSYKDNSDVKKQDVINIINKANEDFCANKYYSPNYVGDIYTSGTHTNNNNKNAFNDYYQTPWLVEGLSTAQITYMAQIQNTHINERIKVDIDVNVQSVSDLLKIIQTYEYKDSEEYNIDLKSLTNIKEELTELDNMIGMNNLKSSILNQLLYFVQELHIEKSLNVS